MKQDSPINREATALEVFFDGACPLCRREVKFLRRMDRRGRILFIDIAAKTFDPSEYGPSGGAFMAEIHGRLSDGTWVRGVEVFRRIYSLLGFGPLVWCTRLPGISGTLNVAYHLFAKNRMRLTGRCVSNDGNCEIGQEPTLKSGTSA